MISRLFFILRKCKVFKNAKRFCCCCLVAQTSLTFATPWTVAQPGSSLHGIFQARILEWVAILFSRGQTFYNSYNILFFFCFFILAMV